MLTDAVRELDLLRKHGNTTPSSSSSSSSAAAVDVHSPATAAVSEVQMEMRQLRAEMMGLDHLGQCPASLTPVSMRPQHPQQNTDATSDIDMSTALLWLGMRAQR